MIPVTVIGTGVSKEDLTHRHLQIIAGADCLAAGRRYLDYFPESTAEKWVITSDIDGMLAWIRLRVKDRRVVVLASGDPLFFGIGSTLIRELGQENLVIYPNISSVAWGFAAIGESWHDAGLVSLHGRQETTLEDSLQTRDLVAVLTDTTNTPGAIAQRLSGQGISCYAMCVLERLGTPFQNITWYQDLESVSGISAASPNLVILKRKSPKPTPAMQTAPAIYPGMPDETYLHEKGLITKADVRSIVLSKLQLTSPDMVLWDLGSGSGSVSIEASVFLPSGRIFSIEKAASRIDMIRENCTRFRVENVFPVHGMLPEAIDLLPDPDRIFIGGGGQGLAAIAEKAAQRLKPGGVIVINTVLVQTLQMAIDTLEQMELSTEAVQVQVSRSRPMPFGHRFEALNPVWVITGSKLKETT